MVRKVVGAAETSTMGTIGGWLSVRTQLILTLSLRDSM